MLLHFLVSETMKCIMWPVNIFTLLLALQSSILFIVMMYMYNNVLFLASVFLHESYMYPAEWAPVLYVCMCCCIACNCYCNR